MTTYDTGNPLGSQDPRDLFDNAQNLDRAVNSLTTEEWIDRFGKPRKTWSGIEKKAQFEIAEAVSDATAEAEGYRSEARDARDDAIAAASATGPQQFYSTFAQALANAAGGKRLVEVSQDESRDGARTRYWAEAGSLTFVLNLDQLRIDLTDEGMPPATVLDSIKPIANYTALRAYRGRATGVRITSIGIAGHFLRLDTPSLLVDNGGTIIVDALGRAWERDFHGEVMASWFGVSSSSADNAAGIMAALRAANPLTVLLPKGVINAGKVTFNTLDTLRGQGAEATTLRLKNGANEDLLYAANSDELWGTNSTDCAIAPTIEGMTLDGNRANNTAGRCLAMYAERPVVRNLVITDAADDGMRTEWSSAASESLKGLEGRFESLTIKRIGGNGWRFSGPHDSHIDDVLIFSSSLKQDRTYQNLWVEKGNARWSRVHSYSTADILPNRVQHSLLVGLSANGNEFDMCHFEGGATNVRVLGNNNIFTDSCRYYYPWDGVNFSLAGNGNIVNGYCGEEYKGIGRPLARGVVFSGDNGGATGNYVDIVSNGCGAGAIDFGGSGGANVVRARGYNSRSTDIGFAALPHDTDEVDVRITGGVNTTIRRLFGYHNKKTITISGFGSSQADATQMGYGVEIFRLDGGAGGSGIRLPNATDAGNGAEVAVCNTTEFGYNIFPSSGGNIAGLGVNNPLAIASLKTARFVVIDAAAGQWSATVG